MSEEDVRPPMLSPRQLASELCVGRKTARTLMDGTRRVITLSLGRKNSLRRMPRKVFEELLIQRSKPVAKAGRK
jgi:hypothetical protein